MKRHIKYLIIVLGLFSFCFPADARVKIIHRHAFKKGPFNPSSKEFFATTAEFKGSRKEYHPSGQESLSLEGKVLPSVPEFKPSTTELMDPKYKPVTYNLAFWPKPYKHFLPQSESSLSEGFDLSEDVSPSAEFKGLKKRRLK